MNVIPKQLTEQVKYQGDSRKYDLELFSLGRGLADFYIINPIWPDVYKKLIDKSLRSDSCIMWVYEKDWLFKRFHRDWTPEHGYEIIELTHDDMPQPKWRKNPDIDISVMFKDNPYSESVLEIPRWDITYKHVWYLDPKFSPSDDKIWVYECKTPWYDGDVKDMGFVTPDVTLEYNPEIPNVEYDLPRTPLYDLAYEHIWDLDAKHEAWEGMWAVKMQASWLEPQGIKYRGNISPRFYIAFNSAFPEYDIEIDPTIPYYDFNYEHIWFLDTKLTGNQKTWLVKLSTTDTPDGVKDMGFLSMPELDQNWVKNTAVNDIIKFSNDPKDTFIIPAWDSKFKHIWYLDTSLTNGEKVWVYECKTSNYDPELGTKDMGSLAHEIDFKFEYNPEIPNLKANIEYAIPYNDISFEHIWFIDQKFTNGRKIWLARLWAVDDPEGVKDMGYLVPDVAENLDVVFISYNEPNAEENWARVLEKAPNALRIDGVKGIFEAHKAAARLAKSDMFYVVDGDAYLVDDWEFDFNPNIFDRDCVHIYKAQNPINKLIYGYGGVKLFPRKLLLEAKEWGVDMTTSIAPKLKVINKISNITAFNTDPITTWRSAFRECAKLAAGTINNQNIMETDRRLKVWLSIGMDQPFGEYALAGAAAGYDYGTTHKLNTELMKNINHRTWLDAQFKKCKISITT
jgi:hypothetical protein